LGGANTYTGATTIGSGATLTIGGAGNLNNGSYAGAITLNGAFIYNSSAAQTNSGTISGAGALTQEGPGTLTLTHANTTFTGTTTINPNTTLALTVVSGAGNGTITDNGILSVTTQAAQFYTPITGGSSSVININIPYNTASENIRYAGSSLAAFPGTVNLIAGLSAGNPGAGQIIMTNNESFPGTWNVGSGATLLLGREVGNVTFPYVANVIINGPGNSQPYGALRLDSVTNTGNVLLNGTGITIGNDSTASLPPSQISGIISDNGQHFGFTRVVSGRTIILSGANTYTGPTVFSAGTLQVASAEIAGTSGPLGKSVASNPGNIVFSGGTLQYSSANSNDYSGRFSTNAGQACIIDVNGQSVTFATPLTSSGGSLTLADTAGGGTLTLSGTNTYNGITTINSGTLNVSGSIKGSTAINVNGSAILELDNSSALSSGTVLTLPSSPPVNSVNLNFSGAQTILALYFGTTQQPAGTYSASSNNSTGAFTGAGTLVVAPQIFWDGNGTDALSQSSGNGGGNGSWDNSTSDWWVSGSSDTKWTSNSIANFAGTAGTVTLNSSEIAYGLTFATSGYTLSGSSNLTLGGTPTIALPDGGVATINCPIAGTGGLTESGFGTLTLGGSNIFTGAVTIDSGGTLVLGGANAYTSATTINNTSTLTITNAGDLGEGSYPGAIADSGMFIYTSSANQTLSGIISGTGTLVQDGPGALTLSGLNTFNGPITINSGTLTISGVGDLNNNPTFNTGGYSGALSDNGAFIYNSSAQQSISSGIYGAGTLTQSGSGTLTLSGLNGYTGATIIGSNSVLIIGGSGFLGNSDYETNITNYGTFTYDSTYSQVLGGIISGSGALIQEGASTLTLTAANTYTGATSITGGGTLALSGSGSINNSTAISIAAGATFDVSALSSSTYTLSGSTALSATGSATVAATINGQPGGVVNLGSQPISLTFTPQATNGDAGHQALNISQGALTLNGNRISVKNSGASALGTGTYTLINVPSGTINGSATLAGVSGAGLQAGTSASLSVSGGSLNLVVAVVPAINSFTFSGGNLVFSGTNGPENGAYYVLTSTNLALPLSNWTSIATNTFSPTGAFSVTNAVSVSPSFFIIEIPAP
jgi:autotransporter-associated beta strand protein